MDKKITVIGSSNVDFIMKMKQLPRSGETITDAEYVQTFGGKGANQAVGAARAGGSVYFVNCVGDDIFSASMVENFKKDGINVDFVFQETGISCGIALVMIGGEGDNYLSVAPGANYKLTPKYIDSAISAITEAEIIIIQNEIPQETIEYIIDTAHRLNKKVLYNFAPAKPFNNQYLKKIWLLVVNEMEAEFLSGQKVNTDAEIIDAANTIANLGAETVIITRGSRGSYLHSKNTKRFISAFKVNAVDSTAAGDVYCGSLAVALSERKSISDAITFASAASAIAVTRLGAQPSAPGRIEIDQFLGFNYH